MKRIFCSVLVVLLFISIALPAFAAMTISDLALQALDLVYSRGGGIIPSSYAYYALFLTSSVTSDNRITIMFSETPVISSGSPVVVYQYSDNGGSPSIWSGSSTSFVRSMVRDTDAAVFVRIKHPGSVTDGTPVHAEKYIGNLSTATVFDQSTVEDDLKSLSLSLTWVRTISLSLPDISALQALVVECQQLDGTVYIPESWSLLQQRLNEGIEVLGRDFYTVPVVNTAYGNLLSAKDSLKLIPVPLPDTTVLESYLSSAKQIENNGFISSSWSALQSAIANAESLLSLPEFTENNVLQAINNLQLAINGLRYPPSSSGLESLISRASQLNADDYTAESWSNFQLALSHANALLSSGNYTSEQLAQVQNSLNHTMNSLAWKPMDTPPAPDGHRYLIDGILPGDLAIAQDAIMQNIDFGRSAGLWVFVPILIVIVSLKVIRSIFGFQGEAHYIDLNSPSENSGFVRDSSGGVFRKSRSKKEDEK